MVGNTRGEKKGKNHQSHGCQHCYQFAGSSTYRILHFGFTVAPILAGLDKFFHPSPQLAPTSAPAHGRAQVVVPAGRS